MNVAAPTLDIGFVLICSALVFLMQAGFCLLESGMIRAKNSINVAVKNLLDFAFSLVLYALVGFSIMFGNSFLGLFGLPMSFWQDQHLTTFFLFQAVFCGTAATIVSGAVAERTKLFAYFLVVITVSSFAYPIVGHWCWAGGLPGTRPGWIANLGFVDWAGGTVVHVTGGFAALAASIAVGPRRRQFRGQLTNGHSLTLAITGCFLLWFGWWGFNGGSALSVGGPSNVPLVLLNTNLAATAGLIGAALYSMRRVGKTDVIDLITGAIAGLVSVTAAAHALTPVAAFCVGLIGALLALVATKWLNHLRIDDAVGAFVTHGVAGVWGTAAFALLAPIEMLPQASRILQLGVQILGSSCAALVSFSSVYAVLQIAKRYTKLRVRAGEEMRGLNVVEHGATNEVTDLLIMMNQHRKSGDFTTRIHIDTDTEAGQIAQEYNSVIQRVQDEVELHEQTNDDLNAEQLRMQSIVEHAGVGIYQLDANGYFQSANATLLDIIGDPIAEDLVENWEPFELSWHRGKSVPREQIQCAFRDGMPIKDLEIEYDLGDEQRWLLESIVPIRDDQGNLVNWLGTVHDVTERQRALKNEVEVAEAKSAAKGEFLANMSHEIRTPLNGVIGMLDLLGNSKLDQKETNYVNVARTSAESLLSIINDILDFSKIEAGKLELETVPFDLRELIESTAELFAVRAHMKGLEMNCELGPDLPFSVEGDPERLRQCIVNLLGNAIKFTEEGEINLRANRRGKLVHFSIQDTGIGISENAQASLFDSFVQADVSTTRRYGGTGLGLTIVNQLVTMMGGKLKVDSKQDAGSNFWFELELPICEESKKDNNHAAQRLSVADANILIVDDNDTNCNILEAQLKNWGIASGICKDSTRVLKRLKVAQQLGKPFDLIILDFCMPEMNGRDVALQIQNDPALQKLPIIMLSSNHDLMTKEQMNAVGINISMTKPARQSRLFDSIITLLSQHSKHAVLPIPGAAEPEPRPHTPPTTSAASIPSNNSPSSTEAPPDPSAENNLPVQAEAGIPSASLPHAPLPAQGTATPASEPPATVQPQTSAIESRVEAPVASSSAQSSTAKVPEPRKSARESTIDVLIAEDNQVNQIVVHQMLTDLGYTTEFANNGKEALDMVSAKAYRLILMDGHMPIMDGLASAREIRQWESDNDRERTPIVALTANVVKGFRQECLDAGMNDYLAKPISLDRLKEVTRTYLPEGQEELPTASYESNEVRSPQREPAQNFSEQSEVPTAQREDAQLSVVEPQADRRAPLTSDVPPSIGISVQSPARSSDDSDLADPPPPNDAVAPELENVQAEPSICCDLPTLMERCGGNEDLKRQLLGIMRETMPRQVAELKQANARSNYSKIRNLSHQLKGAAGDTSLLAVRFQAAELESIALDSPDLIPPTIERLAVQVDRTLQEIDSILQAQQ